MKPRFAHILPLLAAFATAAPTAGPAADFTPAQVKILQAEDRRAPTAQDLDTIRAGLRSSDAQTVRIAVRAMGRLERPSLIADIIPMLRHRAAPVRAEAATATGQAAQGWRRSQLADGIVSAIDTAQSALLARLPLESDQDVRNAIEDTLGRLPYANAAQVEAAEHALLDASHRGDQGGDQRGDQFGVAQGLFRIARLHRTRHPLGDAARARLIEFSSSDTPRVRRLALDALLALGPPSNTLIATIQSSLRDPDAQVRRLAVRGAAALPPEQGSAMLKSAVPDESPVVRTEALRALATGLAPGDAAETCAILLRAVGDNSTTVALTAIDTLSHCGASPDAVAALTHASAVAPTGKRDWHRAAHAIVSLATAAPDRAAAALRQFTTSSIWQLRMYAAQAAATLDNRDALEKLANDADDNVREVAIESLAKLYSHDADPIFVAQLTRANSGYQVLRAAALALVDTPHRDIATPALQAALQRLIAEGRDNSHDARAAIAKALDDHASSASSPTHFMIPSRAESKLTADTLRRLASARARIVIRDLGTFELTLLTDQAPASVVRFAQLAEAGYYNGLTFHRVVPNFVIQGGSPGANEYIGDAAFMRDEVGLPPNVRGAVGVSTRGRDTGDAQIFINLIDNPRLDHDYTVFANVQRGMDIVDQILEGDVIERIEIIR
jgi:cyclophilin family peptidyl-prolyl cis-trans isomerase